jgi:hypothetical protein
MAILYMLRSFDKFSPVLVCCTKKNLATLFCVSDAQASTALTAFFPDRMSDKEKERQRRKEEERLKRKDKQREKERERRQERQAQRQPEKAAGGGGDKRAPSQETEVQAEMTGVSGEPSTGEKKSEEEERLRKENRARRDRERRERIKNKVSFFAQFLRIFGEGGKRLVNFLAKISQTININLIYFYFFFPK